MAKTSSHWLKQLLNGQEVILVSRPSDWLNCPLIGQFLILVLLPPHWLKYHTLTHVSINPIPLLTLEFNYVHLKRQK